MSRWSVVSRWCLGGLLVVSWLCLGGVSVVSRLSLAGVLVVSRWCLGGAWWWCLCGVLVVSRDVLVVSWRCLEGVCMALCSFDGFSVVPSWCPGGLGGASVVAWWCLSAFHTSYKAFAVSWSYLGGVVLVVSRWLCWWSVGCVSVLLPCVSFKSLVWFLGWSHHAPGSLQRFQPVVMWMIMIADDDDDDDDDADADAGDDGYDDDAADADDMAFCRSGLRWGAGRIFNVYSGLTSLLLL